MTTQIAVKLPEEIVHRLDALVTEGTFASRSAAVRRGIELVMAGAARRQLDAGFEEGYQRMPDTDEELEEARRSAIESIEAEPWEPWW